MGSNKKLHIKNLIVVAVIIILLIVGISITMSRYKSGGTSTFNADVAFYVVEDTYDTTQVGNIFLKDLYPRTETFDYTLKVSNHDGTNTSETSIDYTIEMEITTNLPLTFKIYKDNTELTSTDDIENTVVLDGPGGSYIRKIKIKKGSFTYGVTKDDIYKIAVTFPIGYAEQEEFEGMIDNINIKLDSKQRID